MSRIDMLSERPAWALDCETAEHKLLLVYLDAVSALTYQKSMGRDPGEHITVSREIMAQACGLNRDNTTTLLLDLHRQGLIDLVSYTADEFDICLADSSEEDDPENLGVPYRRAQSGQQKESGTDIERYVPRPPWLASGHRRRAKLAQAQQGKCWYCGCRLSVHEGEWREERNAIGYLVDWVPAEGFSKPAIEHQTPRSRGGSNRTQNLVLSCSLCNGRKLDRSIEEFRDWCSIKGWGSPVVFFGETLAKTSVAGDEP